MLTDVCGDTTVPEVSVTLDTWEKTFTSQQLQVWTIQLFLNLGTMKRMIMTMILTPVQLTDNVATILK